MALQLVSFTNVTIAAPAQQLFCPHQLNEYARDDIFVRLPAWSELPRSMRSRVIHARHLRRIVDYAVRLLEFRHQILHDAQNEQTMAGQNNKTSGHHKHHLRNSRNLRTQSQNNREQAHLLFRTVGAAEVL